MVRSAAPSAFACASLAGVLTSFTGSALAACDNTTPGTGVTVTCSGASATPVNAQVGSTGVTVNVLGGASLNAVSGVVVQGASRVDNAGTINASSGSVGIAARLDDNVLVNEAGGVVQTVNPSTAAIVANGNRNQLLNFGLISTQNSNAYGLSILTFPGNTLVDNVLTNSGTIRTLGTGAHAVFAQQNDRATITNTGTIETRGTNASGLRAVGGSNVVTNASSVQTFGADSNAVYVQGNNNSVVNRGQIGTSGSNAEAVFSNTAGSSFTATITNEAGASITSAQSLAIRGLNGQETVINAGTISSGAGTAISLGGGNDMVVLRTGSVINGSIDGGAGTDGVQLEGSGTSGNAFLNFETLRMQGDAWTFAGSGTFNSATLTSGVFTLSGVLTAPVTVQPGATLTGAGRVAGDLAVQGVVRPGATPGTGVLTVDGNYTQAAGSTLEVTQTPNSADRIMVGGSATLQGGTVHVLSQQAGSYNAGRVPIVTAAGGLSGTFDALQLPMALLSDTSLSYDADNAYLTVVRKASFASAAPPASNAAQVAAVLDAVEPVATGSLQQASAEIAMLPTQPQVVAAFDNLGGSVYPTLARAGLRDNEDFARSLTQRLAERRGSPASGDTTSVCSDAHCGTAVWARAFGVDGRLTGSSGVAGVDTRTRGLAVGTDREITPATRVGAGLEVSRLDADFRVTPAASAQADSYKLGVFGSMQLGEGYLAGVLSYGRFNGDLDRQILIGSLAAVAHGRIRADIASASLEAGRPFSWGATTLEPIATLSYARLKQQALSETGAGEVGLRVGGQSLESTQAGLGVRLRRAFELGSGRLTLEGRARWAHELSGRDATARMAFVGAPYQGFDISGATVDRNLKLLGIGASYELPSGFTTQLVYEASVGGDDRYRSLMLRVRKVW
ncbi:Extracellular serine protease precursor [Variovorax sp. SRS16]|uniref:autotransporter outer membrane beta-barrel domain-containing protein n=1 Tax=Variovorax sp. SRS16 TaxID=282217 RepID=UPI00131782B6|nr:autotransporter outer membrane beta-barrel domain-containing protein [Variovorax sp. SRS16]VTU17898.1 Extracellular serine protease precursor [Variovorax sp. SRS16]